MLWVLSAEADFEGLGCGSCPLSDHVDRALPLLVVGMELALRRATTAGAFPGLVPVPRGGGPHRFLLVRTA